MKEHYRPLPKGLTIDKSEIDGLGLFAKDKFPVGHNFGITHIKDNKFRDSYIRTPLGGFYNHSTSPNCKTIEDGRFRNLISIREISPSDEITVEYTIYKHD